MQFTVRNSTATPGWIVDLGMRVSSRPVRFGETSYLVKNGTEHIEFIQAPDRGRNLNIESPSDGQKVILEIGRAHVCQSLMRNSYAVFCLKKKHRTNTLYLIYIQQKTKS